MIMGSGQVPLQKMMTMTNCVLLHFCVLSEVVIFLGMQYGQQVRMQCARIVLPMCVSVQRYTIGKSGFGTYFAVNIQTHKGTRK